MLRQVAILLERENDKLHAKLQALTTELARLRGDARPAAELELEFLEELLAQRERALFGAASEQRPRPAPPTPSPPPAPRRGHGPTAQPTLPTVEVVHELAAADLTCPQCGGTLRAMAGQTEGAEEITVVERRFGLLKHRRKKYRCACNGCVETAPGPLRLAARPDARGRRYSREFAVEVAVNKYVDHLPLERQARVMSREGLTIESQTLWDQIEALATALQPMYDTLQAYMLAAPVIGRVVSSRSWHVRSASGAGDDGSAGARKFRDRRRVAGERHGRSNSRPSGPRRSPALTNRAPRDGARRRPAACDRRARDVRGGSVPRGQAATPRAAVSRRSSSS